MSRLAGRTALVTGAAGGIGSAIAERLAADGANVAVTDLAGSDTGAVVARIAEGGHAAIGIDHDVTQRESWEDAVTRTVDAFGAVDIVVNNAGITRDRTLVKMTEDEWDIVLAVHLKGTYLGCQQALLTMRSRGWGRIVNISSLAIKGSFGQTNYAAAKAGIVGLTRSVAMEGARSGVLANAIAPGSVDTPMLRGVPADLLEGFRLQIPLQRFAEPAEIAATAAFLASDEAAYITGQTIHVDGGATLG
jgi:3-oxoacyl-[acyl-carrier protein] reductase